MYMYTRRDHECYVGVSVYIMLSHVMLLPAQMYLIWSLIVLTFACCIRPLRLTSYWCVMSKQYSVRRNTAIMALINDGGVSRLHRDDVTASFWPALTATSSCVSVLIDPRHAILWLDCTVQFYCLLSNVCWRTGENACKLAACVPPE